MTRETSRKLIHIAAVAVPLFVWWAPRSLSLALLCVATLMALTIEVARRQSRWARYHFLRLTRPLLRPHERYDLAGATYMVIAFLFVVFLFPRAIAVAGMLYNGLGDAAAALVGRRWGRHRLRWGKSWEGAAAAFVVNVAIGLIVPGFSLAAALIGALAAAALELAPLPLDDNVRVTVGGAVVLWLVG